MATPTNERKERKVCRGGHWPPEWKAYEEKGGGGGEIVNCFVNNIMILHINKICY